MSTITFLQSKSQSTGRRPWRWLAAIAGVILLLSGAFLGYMVWRMSYVPADLDLSTTQMSAQGLYEATIVPDTQPIPVNKMQTWVLHLETPDGQPFDKAAITVAGDMPQHGHGLPTRPQVTQNLGGGDYLVEGLKFQMGGWWVMEFDITANGRSDRVSFNLMLD